VISRHWKGIARHECADRYVDHLEADTFPQLASLPGFIRATVLRRDVAEGIEFQIVTLWESRSAIEAFAGPDPEIAVVPAGVQAMMLRYDERATHYQVQCTFADSNAAPSSQA